MSEKWIVKIRDNEFTLYNAHDLTVIIGSHELKNGDGKSPSGADGVSRNGAFNDFIYVYVHSAAPYFIYPSLKFLPLPCGSARKLCIYFG